MNDTGETKVPCVCGSLDLWIEADAVDEMVVAIGEGRRPDPMAADDLFFLECRGCGVTGPPSDTKVGAIECWEKTFQAFSLGETPPGYRERAAELYAALDRLVDAFDRGQVWYEEMSGVDIDEIRTLLIPVTVDEVEVEERRQAGHLGKRRCAMCDAWYYPTEAAEHAHVLPQSGPLRDRWLASGLAWDKFHDIDSGARSWGHKDALS